MTRWVDDLGAPHLQAPLIRPSRTFSLKGRRHTSEIPQYDFLLPLREKVDRPKAETDEG
jgi:hypothetical protein